MPLNDLSYNELARITAALVEMLGGSVSFQPEELDEIIKRKAKTVLITRNNTSVSLVLSGEESNLTYISDSEFEYQMPTHLTGRSIPHSPTSSATNQDWSTTGAGKPDLNVIVDNKEIESIGITLDNGVVTTATFETPTAIYTYTPGECASFPSVFENHPQIYPLIVSKSTGRYTIKTAAFSILGLDGHVRFNGR